VLNFLRRLETGLLITLFGIMVIVAVYQILARNFFGTGILWGDSMVRIAVLWVTLFGALVASRNDDHIHIDAVSRFLPGRLRRHARRATSAFTALVCGVFAYHSAKFVLWEFEDGVTAFANVPAWVCELPMPVVFGLMGIRYLGHTLSPPETPASPADAAP
jgi:TRAP-type C4-dicarboxylate transport system permease small subunit